MDRSRSGPVEPRAIHLSILASPGTTAWAAHDMDTGRCFAMGELGTGEHWDDHALPPDPRTVTFITLPEWSTLVPEAALRPDVEARHLALVHGGLPSGAMRDEPISTLGARCIYVHDDRSEHLLLERFPAARPLPLQALMVRAAQSRSVEGPIVLVHRMDGRCDVAVANKGDLLLSNSFPARTSSDLLYYTLLATDRSGLVPKEVQLLYSGIHLTRAERDLLDRYFERSRPALAVGDEVFEGRAPKDPERWLALLEQFVCAS